MPEPSAGMMKVTAGAASPPAMAARQEKGVRPPSAAVGTSMMVVSVIGISCHWNLLRQRAAESVTGLLSVTWLLCGGPSGRRGILRDPCHIGAIIFKPLCTLQGVFGGVHHQVPFVIVFALDLDRIEGNCHIFLPRAEEPSDANDERIDFSVGLHEYIHDLADFVVGGIVNILFVPTGHCLGVLW